MFKTSAPMIKLTIVVHDYDSTVGKGAETGGSPELAG